MSCKVAKLLPYEKLMAYVKSIDIITGMLDWKM